MYAFIQNNVIQSVSGLLPLSARRLDTGEWVLGLSDAPAEMQQACGYYEVVETAEPAPSNASMVVESTVDLVNGVPTMVWSERAMTIEEQQAATEASNRSAIETNLIADLAAMQAIIDDTNANINTNPASRIKSQARVLRRLVKMTLNDYSTSE